MTIFTEDYVMSQEVARATRVIAPATAHLMSGLAEYVDMTHLSPGDDRYDYFVRVPRARLHELDMRIVELEMAVEERFGVTIKVMPIGMDG